MKAWKLCSPVWNKRVFLSEREEFSRFRYYEFFNKILFASSLAKYADLFIMKSH